ncbi:MAG: glycosyltransferase family 2 protein, partial [Gammaproteobacteria bacterium]|nr:glycosyltransferase family 2 protein [Gammaproteobacteria bacterium]
MEILFYFFAVCCAYSYFIYPVLLKLLPARKTTEFTENKSLPALSLIITAHNEEGRIREKLENTLQIDY